MKTKTLVISGAALASAAAIGVAGAGLASAGSTPTPQYGYGGPGYGAPGFGEDGGRGHGRGGPGERLGQGLSGETAVRAVQAAVAKEPTATVVRLGKADDGTYRVAMRRTDGTAVVLTLDANFTVTGTTERAPRAERTPRSTATPTSTGTATT